MTREEFIKRLDRDMARLSVPMPRECAELIERLKLLHHQARFPNRFVVELTEADTLTLRKYFEWESSRWDDKTIDDPMQPAKFRGQPIVVNQPETRIVVDGK